MQVNQKQEPIPYSLTQLKEMLRKAEGALSHKQRRRADWNQQISRKTQTPDRAQKLIRKVVNMDREIKETEHFIGLVEKEILKVKLGVTEKPNLTKEAQLSADDGVQLTVEAVEASSAEEKV